MKADTEADVEMKTDEQPEEGKPVSKKKAEPGFENRPNFSRVTPAQLPYISFPSDGRYQPVRAVSSKSSLSKTGKAVASASQLASVPLGLGSEKYGGGGGILILTDLRASEPAEFIEFQPPPAAPAAAPVPSAPAARSQPSHPVGRHISLDESAPEAPAPGSFEVCSSTFLVKYMLTVLVPLWARLDMKMLMISYIFCFHTTLITVPFFSTCVKRFPSMYCSYAIIDSQGLLLQRVTMKCLEQDRRSTTSENDR